MLKKKRERDKRERERERERESLAPSFFPLGRRKVEHLKCNM
jgi:hypothetical protein